MKSTLSATFLVVALAFVATPAHARFGKSSGGSSRSGTPSRSSSTGSSDHTHSASAVTSARTPQRTPYRYYRSPSFYHPYYGFGFYHGAYVPWWGYGYRTYYDTSERGTEEQVQEEPAAVRMTVGAETQGFKSGYSLGVGVGFEGERWGFNLNASNISVRADDFSNSRDQLQQMNAHVSYAFLSGQRGRLRVEGGADGIFAPDLTALGPTGGFSGTVWIGGPFALEGSVMLTPVPYRQVDARAGIAIGIERVGLRAGWRVLALDDRGLVDGVIHQDTFSGPYAGVAVVF